MLMPVDPNVYALSIELQLNAQKAFEQIDTFGESLQNVEQDLSQAATKAFQNISTMSQDIVQSFNNITNITDSFKTNMATISTNYGEAFKYADDNYDLQLKHLKQLLKEQKIIEKLHDIKEEDLDNYKIESKDLLKTLSFIEDIEQAVQQKNISHREEGDLVEKELEYLKEANKTHKDNKNQVRGLSGLWSALTGTLGSVVSTLTKMSEATENFVTVNYRAYGSQVALVQASGALAAQLGITLETAIAVYKALADVKTPQDNFEKLAKTVAITNRVTGISIQSLASFSKSLKAAGLDSEATRRQMLVLAEGMRKYNINAEDASKITNVTGISIRRLGMMLGGAVEVEKFMKLRTVMVGMAQEMGLSSDAALEFTNNLTDPIYLMKLEGAFGGVGEGMSRVTSTLMNAGKQFSDFESRINAAATDGARRQLTAEYTSMTAALDINQDAAAILAKKYRDLDRELKKLGKTMEDAAAVELALANIQNDIWAESNDTLFAQMRILRESLGAVTNAIGNFIGDGLKEIIKVINMVIQPIAQAITQFFAFIEKLKQTNPALYQVVTAIKVLVAIVVVLGAVLLGVAAIFGGFNLIFNVGQMIVNGGRVIGEALAALGNAVRNEIVPLIGLATALAIAGVGAYLFSMAVSNMVQHGWAAVGMLFALVAGVALMGLALVGLGMLAQGPVALGIMVVAGALLAVGFAILLAGQGVLLFSQGLLNITAAINAGILYQLPLLAAVIASFAFTIALAVPILLGAGAAFMLIGVGITIAATGLLLLQAAFNGLQQIDMTAISYNLWYASTILLSAGGMLAVASVMLLAGSVGMLAAMAVLFVVSVSLQIVSGLMIFGSGVMAAASALLLVASIGIGAAAFILMAGVTVLVPAIALLAGTALLMAVAGAALAVGSLSLTIGLAALGLAIYAMGNRAAVLSEVSRGLNVFVESLERFRAIDISDIRSKVNGLSGSFGQMENFATEVNTAANLLNSAVDNFEDPANRLANVLERLGEVITGFGDGLSLGDNVGNLASQLDQYVSLLESASERIAVAIETKAVPAMRAAEEAGITETLRSEAVNTVKVMNEEESDGSSGSEIVELATAQLEVLNQLKEALIGMTGGESVGKDIFNILQQYLPQVGRKNNSLSAELNSWSR